MDPKAALEGSTSVECWLLGLLYVSVLMRESREGGGALELPLSPESELDLGPEPQPLRTATSKTAHATSAARATRKDTDSRRLANPKTSPVGVLLYRDLQELSGVCTSGIDAIEVSLIILNQNRRAAVGLPSVDYP